MEIEKVCKFIEENRFFAPGSIVGVACSGGPDSMALLHFLNSNRERLDIDVMAIYVDHNTRENDARDGYFVADFCKKNSIKFYKFSVESKLIMKKRGYSSMEQACREARFGVFENLRNKGMVDKIAIAHHQNDQAETVLLHILRGSGLNGACGMSYVRDNFYVRPFLDVSKQEILAYLYENEIDYVEDEQNAQNIFSRNILRNKIFPELRKIWPKVDETLCNFAKICKEDDTCIRKLMNFDSVVVSNKNVKIPISYFLYDKALVSRLVFDCFEKLGAAENVEQKHITLLTNFATKGENGAMLDLPNDVRAHKEYEYVTLVLKKSAKKLKTSWPFKTGVTKIDGLGKIKIKKTNNLKPQLGMLLVDADKIPENAEWRFKKEGDFIEKFGGGLRKIKAYLNDKKVPQRLRASLPMLASGGEVLVVAGIDISESLRVTENTKNALTIEFNAENWV